MDVSTNSATIGRRSQNEAMRDLRARLASDTSTSTSTSTGTSTSNTSVVSASASAEPDEASAPSADSASDSSDTEDIDRGTAIITVYNLLSNLGDLNHSNRQAAEDLMQQFNSLQIQVNRANGSGSSFSSVAAAEPAGRSRSAFHTPLGDYTKCMEAAVQTDLDVGALSERAGRLAEENQVLRADVALLMQSLKEQQGMARDYESALAKALGALRAAAFESHVDVGSVQEKCRVLLQSESVLNAHLAEENADLRGALSDAAAAIRAAMDAGGHSDNSSAVL
ncbi:hypothetical protein LPJ66_001489 [Kickxella alabastrina]|uniref:Uncharacterized protein n=1 Tax=Kickxella alabastrina TaxID=61397 RepID=A0ACC1IT26_9FUNG|nr:hypothetical protein LPJ66_001489 [Kickxella alabastrina]